MRTDFLGDCTLSPGLAEALNGSQYLVPRLTREQRRDTIERPLEIAGAEIAPRLVQQILNDVGDDPDQLPVMQHALARTYRLWQRKGQEVPIDLEDYEKAGTLARTLDDHAQSILRGFSAEEQDWTRKLFRRLTKMERRREIRRPARLDGIFRVVGATDANSQSIVMRVIEEFARTENSLLFITPADNLNDRTVDISHESLIRKWTQLKQWVKDEAESAEWYSDLQRDTRRRLAGEADFWSEPQLGQVLQRRSKDGSTAAWADQYQGAEPVSFSEVDDFLEGSKKKERRRKFLRYLSVAGVVLMVITALIAVVKTRELKEAEEKYQALVGERTGELNTAERQLSQATTEPERIKALKKIDQINRELVVALKGENESLKQDRVTLDQQVRDLKTESDTLKAKIAKLEALAVAPQAVTKLAAEVKSAAPDVTALRNEIAELKGRLQGAESRAESAVKERQEAEQRYQKLDTKFREMADASRTLLGSTAAPVTATPDRAGASNVSGTDGTVSTATETSAAPTDLTDRLVRAVRERAASLPPPAAPPLKNFRISRASAVRAKEQDLTFVHDMGGNVPQKGNLYVLAGSPSGASVIPEFTNDGKLSKEAIKKLGDCNAGPSSVGGYTAWCFTVKKLGGNTSQALGDVEARGRKVSLTVTGYRDSGMLGKNIGISWDILRR